ncbi:hypothetical protein NAU58_18050 [Pseudomonas stutzeri]|nr:hypothetical protein [Stutzerimonas stutzeri]MCQ4297484.1 hypothetical protein [Stutzerimonas stutzeri]
MEWVFTWFEAHPGTASWAQAIGTIIALVIAIAVPFHQNRMMRREASIRNHEQAIQLFDSLGAMANFAGHLLSMVQDELNDDDGVFGTLSFAREDHMFSSMQVELDRYPIHQLPDHDSVATALELKSTYTRACVTLRASIDAFQRNDFAAYGNETERFRYEFALYCEVVERLSTQASNYRARIEAV